MLPHAQLEEPAFNPNLPHTASNRAARTSLQLTSLELATHCLTQSYKDQPHTQRPEQAFNPIQPHAASHGHKDEPHTQLQEHASHPNLPHTHSYKNKPLIQSCHTPSHKNKHLIQTQAHPADFTAHHRFHTHTYAMQPRETSTQLTIAPSGLQRYCTSRGSPLRERPPGQRPRGGPSASAPAASAASRRTPRCCAGGGGAPAGAPAYPGPRLGRGSAPNLRPSAPPPPAAETMHASLIASQQNRSIRPKTTQYTQQTAACFASHTTIFDGILLDGNIKECHRLHSLCLINSVISDNS